jgi:hypothetical protein
MMEGVPDGAKSALWGGFFGGNEAIFQVDEQKAKYDPLGPAVMLHRYCKPVK